MASIRTHLACLLSLLVTTAAAQAPTKATPPQQTARPVAARGPGMVQGAGPWSPARRLLGQRLQNAIGSGSNVPLLLASGRMAFLTAIATQADRGPVPSPFTGGTALNLALTVPSTGLAELFSLHVPAMAPGARRPMVVAFHSYNRTHLEIPLGTDVFDEAAARGWFALAPVQRSAVGNPLVHYGSVQSQEHVEAVMAWVLRTYGVDRDRIYGVGFSMGGGAAMSYAARHRSRAQGAFAAVGNHTGSVALAHTHAQDPAARVDLEQLFGGSPTQVPFAYQRSSTVELDGAGNVVPGGRHMATNLAFTDVRTYFAGNDTLTYLVDQSQGLTAYMQSLPFAAHDQLQVTAPASCINVMPGVPVGHCWASIDMGDLFDWFGTKVLEETPPFGTLLADRSGRWHGFDLVQDTTGTFSSLDFAADPAQARLAFTSLVNVRSVTVDLVRTGFDPNAPVQVTVSGADGTAERISLTGFGSRPSAVSRNQVGALQTCLQGLFPAWCYDQSTDTVTLYEPGSAMGSWVVTP